MIITVYKEPKNVDPGILQEDYFWDPMGEVEHQTYANTEKDNSLPTQLQIGTKLYLELP